MMMKIFCVATGMIMQMCKTSRGHSRGVSDWHDVTYL